MHKNKNVWHLKFTRFCFGLHVDLLAVEEARMAFDLVHDVQGRGIDLQPDPDNTGRSARTMLDIVG